MHEGTFSNVHYDMVIENDQLKRLQINFKSITLTLEWEGFETPMNSRDATVGDI
jgi:hypothetical protein